MMTKMTRIAVLRSDDGDTKQEPVPRGFRPNAAGYPMPNGKRYFVVAVLDAEPIEASTR